MINRLISFISWMLNIDNMNYYCDVALEAGCESLKTNYCSSGKCPLKDYCEMYKLDNNIL